MAPPKVIHADQQLNHSLHTLSDTFSAKSPRQPTNPTQSKPTTSPPQPNTTQPPNHPAVHLGPFPRPCHAPGTRCSSAHNGAKCSADSPPSCARGSKRHWAKLRPAKPGGISIPGTGWEAMGFPWEIMGFAWETVVFACETMGFPGETVGFPGETTGFCMGNHGIPRGNHELSRGNHRFFMDFRGFPMGFFW